MKGNNFERLEGLSQYIGTKVLGAKPMVRLEYNQFRGWDLPDDEIGEDAGYIVQDTDNYVSWIPANLFKEYYRKIYNMTFGLALDAMRKGSKVARLGWNGKNMFIFLVPGSTFKVNRAPLMGIYPEGTEVDYHAHVDMKMADGMVVPWLCSQTDMLAEDWVVVD